MRDIPDIAVDFIAQHEGCKLTAYQDVIGVWTIGYGSTMDVKQGDKISPEQAKVRLRADLGTAAGRIEDRIGDIVAILTENQYAALLSFVFNVGAGAGWTIWKRLRAKQFDQVPLELMKFVNASGQKVLGLVNRRADECKLWAKEETGTSTEMVPSSITRQVGITPPTPSDPIPPQRSTQLISGAVAATATTGVAVQQLTAQVLPFAAHSEIVGKLVSALAVIGAIAVVVGFVFAWIRKREARH